MKKPSNTESTMLRAEEVKTAAYYIWEEKGRPENSAVQDWLEAEKRVRAKG